MRRRKGWHPAGILTCAVLIAGCGDLTAGGLGEVEVYGTADESGASPAASTTPSAYLDRRDAGDTPARTPSAAVASVFSGVLAAQMQVYLQADGTAQWVEITDGVRDLTLDLAGGLERRIAVRFVDSGRYSRLRVVFHRVETTVLGGLVVGGVPLTGQITVDLGAQGSVTVERDVLVEVQRDEGIDLVLDLNVDVWLPTVSVLTRTVSAAALRDALSVRVR